MCGHLPLDTSAIAEAAGRANAHILVETPHFARRGSAPDSPIVYASRGAGMDVWV